MNYSLGNKLELPKADKWGKRNLKIHVLSIPIIGRVEHSFINNVVEKRKPELYN